MTAVEPSGTSSAVSQIATSQDTGRRAYRFVSDNEARTMARLHTESGLSYTAIAKVLGRNVTTVRTTILRVLGDKAPKPSAVRRPRAPQPRKAPLAAAPRPAVVEAPRPDPLRPITDEEVIDWWTLYDRGRTIGQVAEHFTRPAWAVHAKLLELDVIRDGYQQDECDSGGRKYAPGPEGPDEGSDRRRLAAQLLATEAGQRIAAALANLDPRLDDDMERPHFSDGTIGGSMPYIHRGGRHYCPVSARQREMDRLAKPRGTYRQVCNDLRAAGLLPGYGQSRGHWS